jgi:hypothetical protein
LNVIYPIKQSYMIYIIIKWQSSRQ